MIKVKDVFGEKAKYNFRYSVGVCVIKVCFCGYKEKIAFCATQRESTNIWNMVTENTVLPGNLRDVVSDYFDLQTE